MARVAIVDDSTDTAELFQFILKDHHDFLVYSDPRKFIEDFSPGAFAVILLDLVMPGMDGFEVFRRIRLQDKDVPVVAITVVAQEKEREKALSEGFCDYFIKPILDIERFRAVIYSHIGKCANTPYDSSKKEPAE
jgi:DNA-binding response OmpR family regulator